MPHLLHLDSSADGTRSASRSITRAFCQTWQEISPRHTVCHRDLREQPPPHLPDASLHWPAHLRPNNSPVHRDAEDLQRTLVDELLSADVLLVGAPMYNYSVPSSLKAWLDYVRIPGVTAPYEGSARPLLGRTAVVVASRGGSYDAGSATEGWDHGVPMLELVLGHALGMSVEVIATNLTSAGIVPALADQQQRATRELQQAHERATELAQAVGRDKDPAP